MWNSLESASFWHSVSNWLLIGGAGITAGALVINFLTGDVKEQYLKLEIAKSNKQAAEANQKTEEERLARIKIEEKLAPRFLTKAQYDALCDKLAPFSSRIAIDILLYPEGASDIFPLTQQILSALAQSGWNVKVWTTIGSGTYVRGIAIGTRAESGIIIENAVKSLIDGLNSASIMTSRMQSFVDGKLPAAMTGPTWDENNVAPIRMLIGSKP